tara:strand:+ start:2978 stop:3319 length:342 start_codon:yes stop_codon:yes gene_type:complete
MQVLCGRPHGIAQKKVRKNSYLRFAEKLNGRCAMQGTLWAVGSVARDWNGTGNHQFDALYFSLVTGAVAVGTAITYDEESDLSYSVFTPEAELDNGRLAMIGMGAYLGYQLLA